MRSTLFRASCAWIILLALGSLGRTTTARAQVDPVAALVATDDSRITCTLQPPVRAQRIAYLDARIASLTRSKRDVMRNLEVLRSNLRSHILAHSTGSWIAGISTVSALTAAVYATGGVVGPALAPLARLAATVIAGAPLAGVAGFTASRILASVPHGPRGITNDNGYVMNSLESPRIREFMSAEHCKYGPCSPVHPEFRAAFQSIETSRQFLVREFEQHRPRWYVPELISQSEAHRIAEIEIPHALVIQDYLAMEIEFYLRLKSALELGRITC